MSQEKEDGLSQAVRWTLGVLGVVLPSAVACLIAYVVYPQFQNWFWDCLNLLLPPMVVATLLVLLGILGYGAWTERQSIAGWARERYLAALLWLSRPVREDLLRRLRSKDD